MLQAASSGAPLQCFVRVLGGDPPSLDSCQHCVLRAGGFSSRLRRALSNGAHLSLKKAWKCGSNAFRKMEQQHGAKSRNFQTTPVNRNKRGCKH